MATRAPVNISIHMMKGECLASEGIREGYYLVVDSQAPVQSGDLAIVELPRGGTGAKRVEKMDLPYVVGRVIQSYIIPRDCEYLVIRDLKNY